MRPHLNILSPVLRLEPNDPDALQTKLALLLHTEQYAPALALAESLSGDAEHTAFALEFGRAYALYRLNREPEASDVVKQINPEGDHEARGVMHMEAQIVNTFTP
jgi:signal recognition particle subunit SRP72